MELRVLQYFLAVAREQSILKAAESLHLSQPTLSTQIKNMEEELGKQLLIRGIKGSRKIVLTEEGMILRKRAEEILDLVKKQIFSITTSYFLISNLYFINPAIILFIFITGRTPALPFFRVIDIVLLLYNTTYSLNFRLF